MITHKNIMRLFSVLLVSALMASCNDSGADYYNTKSTLKVDKTILEYLRGEEEFSEFVTLLETTGQIAQLEKNTLMTVMAPVNESMPETVEHMTEFELQMLAKNHLCLTMLYTRSLARLDMVRTLAGKALDVEYAGGKYMIDRSELTLTDVVCKDGVVHRSSNWLVTKLNLEQWLGTLSNDYSMFRDTMKAYTTRTFDKANSQILGVDEETGQVYYDSVWLVNNALINNVDLKNESVRYTMIVPSNQAFLNCYAERRQWLEDYGFEMTLEDTLAINQWLMQASLYEGVIDYETGHTYTSVKNNELRSDMNTVAHSTDMSNGRALTMSKSYAPKYLNMRSYTWNPYYPRRYQQKTADWWTLGNNNNNVTYKLTIGGVNYDEFNCRDGSFLGGVGLNNTNNSPDRSRFFHDFRTLLCQFNSNGAVQNGNYYQCRSSVCEWKEVDGPAFVEVNSVAELIVPAGRYDLYMQFKKIAKSTPLAVDNNTNTLRILNMTDGEPAVLIGEVTGIVSYASYDSEEGGLVARNVQFSETDKSVVLRIEVPGMPANGQNRRINIGNIRIAPSKNNY